MSSIGSSNIGFQLLKKSGWKEGTGLGAQEQGRLEPVETRVENNKRGLGSKEPKPKPKVEDDVETAPSKRPKQDAPATKKAKLAAKRIRKMQEEEKRAQEREFEIAFFREFWPDNV
ncbi:G patch domain-containing protein 11-like isoform X1 [Triticum dicoccoides]|uniref:G patch domain-containing protein 11-like isoform X1 n=1 Tax=Triticum dicoccoides TaxID=85692 RepID=UPI000E7A7238|nr:G patch domain-containing protein 11-like isoform X1 [Triticum dicoccoides]